MTLRVVNADAITPSPPPAAPHSPTLAATAAPSDILSSTGHDEIHVDVADLTTIPRAASVEPSMASLWNHLTSAGSPAATAPSDAAAAHRGSITSLHAPSSPPRGWTSLNPSSSLALDDADAAFLPPSALDDPPPPPHHAPRRDLHHADSHHHVHHQPRNYELSRAVPPRPPSQLFRRPASSASTAVRGRPKPGRGGEDVDADAEDDDADVEEDEDDEEAEAEMGDMSTDELRQRLKEALSTIREKERDLIIAAEIGQQLVAANTSLVNEYEELLTRTQSINAMSVPRTAPAPPPHHHHHARSPATSRRPSRVASPTDAASAAPDFTTAAALRASKRASMSLEMSRLALEDAAVVASVANEETGAGGEGGAAEVGVAAVGGMIGAVETSAEEVQEVAKAIRRVSREWKTSPEALCEYVATLETVNAELRDQLTVAVQNLQDAECVRRRTHATLHRANADLQRQLRATLQDLRDAERSHADSVSRLEQDLDRLRAELSSTSMAAQELDAERRRLLKERQEAQRERLEVESHDMATIEGLAAKLSETETEAASLRVGRREAERRNRALAEENERLRLEVARLEEGRAEDGKLRAECDRLEALVAEMRDQLEEQRLCLVDRREEEILTRGPGAGADRASGVTTAGEMVGRVVAEADGRVADASMMMVNSSKPGWEWTPWLNSVKNKCWDRDISGLTHEIDNLRKHRVAAYQRLRSEMDVMMGSLVSVLPASIQSITTRVVGIPSSPSS
ncbi:hypothetical protein HDU96_011073 [Phlyctochytrium bullatum]|nr:hypothetical protein HDU96_011073 [Phlyctochytrium bullatum]